MIHFQGKTAVITGGASGIGRAMAERFAQEGMRIVLADIEAPALERAVDDMQQNGAEVIGVCADVSHYEQVEALAARAVEAFGGVHILCNNAGVASNGAPAWKQSAKDWEWVINVNLWSVIHGIRAFVPRMLSQDEEGHVVNTASLAGLLAMPLAAPYHVTKFGVVALTESLYLEFASAQAKLGVSVLCPAWVKTNILESARNRPASLRNDHEDPIDGSLEAAFRKRIEAEGLDASHVAARVFQAVRDNQLYILTHPEFNNAIRWRVENIVAGRNPSIEGVLGGMKKELAPEA
jgi:NAD(P)-dependent dehydrogenase (short-subunit alcohol dehydrogenase family)